MIYILFKKLLCSTCLLTKDRKIHFFMLHHEESPEKPQYNMVTPPPYFALPPFPPPFLAKISDLIPFSSTLKKLSPPP